MNKIIELYKIYKEIILYLIFGVLSTVINIVAFWMFNDVINIDYKISNIIAWVLAVIFAFITNKIIVFESKNKSKQETTKEVISFLVARLISLVADMIIMIVMIDVMKINSIISKVVANIVVVIINYIFSKFIIFKKEA